MRHRKRHPFVVPGAPVQLVELAVHRHKANEVRVFGPRVANFVGARALGLPRSGCAVGQHLQSRGRRQLVAPFAARLLGGGSSKLGKRAVFPESEVAAGCGVDDSVKASDGACLSRGK